MTSRQENIDRSGRSQRLRGWWFDFERAISWHRRKLAVVCAVGAVLTGLTAVAPPRPDTVAALRVTADLAGGSQLSAADLRVDQLPAEALPAGALHDPAAALGRTIAGRVPRGQVLSTTDLVGGRRPGSAGRVIAPVRLADAELTALLSDGDLVDVLGADERGSRARPVATGVRVIAVPAAARDPAAGVGSGLVLVEVDRSTANALAAAAVEAQLSVIWR